MQGKSFFFRTGSGKDPVFPSKTTPSPLGKRCFPLGKAPFSPLKKSVFHWETTFWTEPFTPYADKKSMSFQASFKQILREKMGSEPFVNASEESLLNADPSHLAFLMGQVGRKEFNSPRGQYPAPKVRPQRKAHNFSPSQQQAYEFLKSWIYDLPAGFTASELKKAFRQAAMILHPDHGGNAPQFVELKAHYETLRPLVSL